MRTRVLPLISVIRVTLILVFIFSFYLSFSQDSAILASDTISTNTLVDSGLQSEVVVKPIKEIQRDFGQRRNTSSNGVYFFIGLGTFLLFGGMRFLYSKHISELLTILSRSTLGRMNSKESIWQNVMPRWLFVLVYFLSAGYIVGRLIEYYGSISESPLTLWFWGILVLYLGYLFKYLTVHAVALVFRFNKTAVSFFNHISVVNQLLGLILLPICGILMLLPDKMANILLIIAGALIVISLIFKLLINMGYVRNLPRVSYLHFILYLCTLEFIPLAVFARYVYNGVGA